MKLTRRNGVMMAFIDSQKHLWPCLFVLGQCCDLLLTGFRLQEAGR